MIDQQPSSPLVKQTKINSFAVRSRTTNTITLDRANQDSRIIDTGVLLDLVDLENNQAGTAVITSFTDTQIVAKIVDDPSTNYKIAIFRDWWNPEITSLEILSTDSFTSDAETCSLNVKTLISEDHKAGYIGWSLIAHLFDEQDPPQLQSFLTPIALGNDYQDRGVLSFQHPGKWKKGNYYLRAKRYSVQQMIALQEVTASWCLKEETLILSYGSISDTNQPLVLR